MMRKLTACCRSSSGLILGCCTKYDSSKCRAESPRVFKWQRSKRAFACSRTMLSSSFGMLLSFSRGRVVGHANRRERALFVGAAEIAHAALQDIGVRQNDLLAGLAAQARGLDADVFDLADEGVDHQAVADHEGLVERDRQRGEQIAEHVLQSQRDRHAADAQAGEQRGDVDAEVVERHQDQQRPDQHARDEIDDVQRARENLIRRRAPAPSISR